MTVPRHPTNLRTYLFFPLCPGLALPFVDPSHISAVRRRKSLFVPPPPFLLCMLIFCFISPPPILEMPATFILELTPGQHVALDTTVSSDELDMARMEDGTTVDGMFWGKLDIVHDGDTHKMEFSGTRLQGEDVPLELLVDTRVITKLAVAAKPPVARCRLSLIAPSTQYCEVTLQCAPMWTMGITWPTAETLEEGKVKYFLRVHPGGGFEHFETEMVATSIYYEVM